MNEISINYFQPLTRTPEYSLSATNRARIHLGRLPLFNYSHQISADGGLESAQLSGYTPDNGMVQDWFENGVGRHIEATDAAGVFFDGFVEKVTIVLGNLTVTRGPMSEVCNRVRVQYTIVTWEVNPPVGGDEATTEWADDLDSQKIYGVIERTVSGGEMTDEQAIQLRDTYLERHKQPGTTQEFSAGGNTSARSLSIDVLGYRKWFELYSYTDDTSTGITTATAKILAVIAADTSNIFSTDYSNIYTNVAYTGAPEDNNRDAWTIIKDIVALGDAGGTRWMFTVRPGRIIHYNAVQAAFIQYEYGEREGAPHLRLFNDGTNPQTLFNDVPAWRVFPGMWVFARGYMPATPIAVPLSSDPRLIFIERVEYTYPHGLNITCGQVSTPRQTLANTYGLATE